MNEILPSIAHRVQETFFVDTHEHLPEESRRLAPIKDDPFFPCDDWSYLFLHYAKNDLLAVGMSVEEQSRFYGTKLSPREKWQLFAPYWPQCKHTGYAQAVRHTLRLLYDEEELGENNVDQITEKVRRLARKGYYYKVLRDHARVETAQVHCLENFFRKTEYPDLLMQDISVAEFCQPHMPSFQKRIGRKPEDLNDWYAMRDDLFQRNARAAVAMKCLHAYWRPLRHDKIMRQTTEPLFARWAKGETLPQDELFTLETHLFRACIEIATEYGLPVKLHTGYHAGNNTMPMEWVKQNATDVSRLLREFPKTKFVLMHIGYPYQHEMIALAKHYANTYIDLCWAWIIDPIACVQFVKRFLLAVPTNKLLTFGGDYITVETVVGHAHIARQGLAQALSELVRESWISEPEAIALIGPLMRGNAYELFNIERKLKQPA